VVHALKDRAGRQVVAKRAANLRRILRAKAMLAEGLGVPQSALRAKPHFVEHHVAHIGFSFYVSPFERAALLSIDGFGDMVSAMWGVERVITSRSAVRSRSSTPSACSTRPVTQYLGFPKYGDEYKVMGLASYGEPEHLDVFRRIVRSDGVRYELGLDYFRHHVEGAAMTWDGGSPELPPLWGSAMERDFGPARGDGPLEPHHQNVAASLQRRLEEVVLGCCGTSTSERVSTTSASPAAWRSTAS
jgi:carbamoyltransferase